MSVRVEIEQLRERIAEYGPVAFLTTVGADGRAHVVSVRVEGMDDSLLAGAGRTTARNIESNPSVTLLWSAIAEGAYCLIVDGMALVRDAGADAQVVVTPSRAVLHRLAGAEDAGPSCITILDPPT